MPVGLIYPNVGALWLAELVQAALANSVVSLFQGDGSFALEPTTVKADLEAVEADYTGYVAIAVVAFNNPLLDQGGGASIRSPLLQPMIASPYTVPNTIQGWWLEETGGDLICAGDFPAPRPLVGAGDGIPFIVELAYGG